MLVILLQAACGNELELMAMPGTPTGTHSIPVQATAGTLNRSVNITVVVQ